MNSDILFLEDTAVLHVSGNRDSPGRIVKTNQGLTKIFGYSKSEVVGHLINILMPSIFSKRHSEFMESFFKTGHKALFNSELALFGLHRNGFCLQIKILIKQMPSLQEGIQYVGFIRQVFNGSEIIITDTRGVIDSFSSGLSAVFNLPVSLFKEAELNIQVLAPELMWIFGTQDKKKSFLEKFKEIGGQRLSFIVPKDFAAYCQTDNKKAAGGNKEIKIKTGESEHLFKKGKGPLFWELNKDLNKHKGISTRNITIDQLIQSPEYKDCECKQNLKCEINDLAFCEDYKIIDPLYLRVFKVQGIKVKNVSTRENLSSCGSPCDSGDFFASKSSYGFDEMCKKGSESKIQGNAESLLNLINNNGTEKQLPKVEPEHKEPRQDTKTTERIPGNTFTNESLMNTIEATQDIKKPEEKKGHSIPYTQIIIQDNLIRKKSEKEEEKVKQIQKDDAIQITPRLELGDLKEPGLRSNVADVNSFRPNDDSVNDTDSKAKSLKKDEEITINLKEDFPEVKGINKKKGDKTMEEEEISVRETPKIFGKQDKNILKDKPLVPTLKIGSLEENLMLNRNPNNTNPECSSLKNIDINRTPRKMFVSKGTNQGSLRILLPEPEVPDNVKFDTPQNDCRKKTSFKSPKSSFQEEQKPKILTISTKKIIAGLCEDDEDDELEVLNDSNLTEDEIKVRKALQAYEKNKSKEQKKKENKKEEKKKDEEKDEESKSEKENDNAVESESENEGKKDKADKEEQGSPKKQKITTQLQQDINMEEEMHDGMEMSSISAEAGATMRSYHSMRSAIEDKYIPPSIRNLSCSANIVFALLLGLASIFLLYN